MFNLARQARTAFACAVAALALTFVASAPAQAAMYVDKGLTDLTPEQVARIDSPQPVQVVFEFLTKAKPNKRAAKFVHGQVLEAVRNSGLFSEVAETPVSNGAVLTIVLNNVPEEGAAGKGVLTGLTFGLKTALVTDYYVCTVTYQPPAGASPIVKTANHSLHTTIGLASVPVEGVLAPSIEEAVFMMTRQIVSHAVNELGRDPGFSGAATVMVAASEPEVADPEALEPGALENDITPEPAAEGTVPVEQVAS